MYYVYILYSKDIDQFYIGSTADIGQRIYKHKHNQKHRGFTAQTGDWQLMYSESYQTKAEGLKRELQIKKWKNRKMIEKLIGSGWLAHPDFTSGGSQDRPWWRYRRLQ
jgi:putative endonuclease